jgi:hypothetical protein
MKIGEVMIRKRSWLREDVNSRFVGQDARKVFFPNPTDKVRRIVLILSQPEFAFLTNNVENLRKINVKIYLAAKELA